MIRPVLCTNRQIWLIEITKVHAYTTGVLEKSELIL